MHNALSILEEISIDSDIVEMDNEIAQVCESFGISSLNDLTLDMIEELNLKQIQKHTNTGRGGLHARRLTRLVVAGAILPGIGPLLMQLSEVGVIPTTEKHAFIRFQGMVTIHAKRIDKRLGGTKARDMIKEARKAPSGLTKDSPISKIEEVYSNMVSTEAAVIVSGYVKVMEKAGADTNQLDSIKHDLTNLKTSFVKGAGIWSRLKSGLSSVFFSMGVVPAFSVIGQLQILDKKAPKLKLIANAQKKMTSMVK